MSIFFLETVALPKHKAKVRIMILKKNEKFVKKSVTFGQ